LLPWACFPCLGALPAMLRALVRVSVVSAMKAACAQTAPVAACTVPLEPSSNVTVPLVSSSGLVGVTMSRVSMTEGWE
jgi:hypothetical protein